METRYLAFRAARKGKRNWLTVDSFGFDLEHNLLTLPAELLCLATLHVRH
jgi:hypothetical protein